ncbi:MAG: hypothetical protein ACRCTP_05885 [Aeromonas popoffii]|uniref:hypothetical protein n=1 Tax=Aeromonas popoffii TaxID=70856 RepID=UPI003F2B30CB
MTIARSRQISLADTPYYHVVKSWDEKLGHPSIYRSMLNTRIAALFKPVYAFFNKVIVMTTKPSRLTVPSGPV